MVKGFYIYSSTVKYAFDTYECLLVNNDGKRCYPQVKSGNVSLNANDYMRALDFDPDADIYLFAVSESYTDNGCKNIKFIYKRELEDFIKQYNNLLPKLLGHQNTYILIFRYHSHSTVPDQFQEENNLRT